jgi:hypothetical protein
MVKSGKRWDENLKRFFYFVWLKLKMETKMRKGKYASKIKTDHLGREGLIKLFFIM